MSLPSHVKAPKIWEALKSNPLQCQSREALLEAAGYDLDAEELAIDSVIKRMRQNKKCRSHIKSLYGRGYYYEPHPENYRRLLLENYNGLTASKQAYLLYEVKDSALTHKSGSILTLGGFEVDTGCDRLFHGKRFVSLPPREAAICKLLFDPKNKDKLFLRDAIQRYADREHLTPLVVSDFVKRIRWMMEVLAGPEAHEIIQTIYGEGYKVNRALAERFDPSLFLPAARTCGERSRNAASARECHRSKDSRKRQKKNPSITNG
jgi:DNA-binding response OmpR family regulator